MTEAERVVCQIAAKGVLTAEEQRQLSVLAEDAVAAGVAWLETGGDAASESLRRVLDAYRKAGAGESETLEILRRSVTVVESRAVVLGCIRLG